MNDATHITFSEFLALKNSQPTMNLSRETLDRAIKIVQEEIVPQPPVSSAEQHSYDFALYCVFMTLVAESGRQANERLGRALATAPFSSYRG